ncbi:MAG TPA: hypothetical protein VGO52_04510 [Hyphomonadaceae bacterium]|jgi:hypothetical protein|nr:hypothetical protein [Hyphomonadaceae bacterium]
MLRKLLVAIAAFGAALGASACSYGSAVDIAPMNARISKPVIAPGDYCEVKGETAPFSVISKEDCAPLIWNAATRTYTMKDPDKPAEDMTAPVIRIDGNLYAAQITTSDAKGPDAKGEDRYQLYTFVASGNAFVMISPLDDEPLEALAAKTKKLTFKPAKDGRPYIAAGKPEDIRAFLKDAARESLRIRKKDDDVSIGIRDIAGAPDHSAGKQQQKDIEAVLAAVKALTPK